MFFQAFWILMIALCYEKNKMCIIMHWKAILYNSNQIVLKYAVWRCQTRLVLICLVTNQNTSNLNMQKSSFQSYSRRQKFVKTEITQS